LPQALDEIAGAVATIRYFATLDLPREVLKEDATRKVSRSATCSAISWWPPC
jgi:hypothetical protein